MTKLWMSVALMTVMAAVPAAAKSKSEQSMKDRDSLKQSDVLKQEGQNREPGENGTYQGKPVVQGPVDWSKGSANAGSTTSGPERKSRTE